MKTAITLVLLATLTTTSTMLNAQSSPFLYDNQAWQQHLEMQRQQYQPQYHPPTQTLPNVFGGEDFYERHRLINRSVPNVFGGRNFYRR